MGSHDGGARVQQRLDALARANRLRTARARLKRRIAAGEVSCADLVLRPSWEIERMPIAALLASQRYWGQERCRQFLRSIKMTEVKSIGSMTQRQRLVVATALDDARTHSPTASRPAARHRHGARASDGEVGGDAGPPIATVTWAAKANPVRTLKLTGEFDLSNVHRLSRALSDAVDSGIRGLVVDLSEVSFLDATTLHTLQAGRNGSEARKGTLILVRPPAHIWRIFVLTGLSRAFQAFGSREDALECARRSRTSPAVVPCASSASSKNLP